MKRIIAATFLFYPFLVNAQDVFTVDATVGHDSAPAKAYLLYKNGDLIITDSAVLTKGSFKFKGALQEPTLARLIIDHTGAGFAASNSNSDMNMMYLEKGVIRIRSADSLKRAVITGSVINKEYAKYKDFISEETKRMSDVSARYRAAAQNKTLDSFKRKSFEDEFEAVQEAYKTKQYAFIKANPDSYVSLFTLREAATGIIDLATVEPAFNSLSARLRQSVAGQELKSQIDKKHAVDVGQTAPDFTQNDPEDKPVKLSDFKGKFVLLDFWASWCVPCRAENPFVVKAYNKYKDRDFTVVSVSLDRPGKKEDWLAAIKKDGLTWTQVSDLKFWNNEVALLYGIKSVPQNFLIDKEGKIIAANLHGEALDPALEKLLK